VKIWDPLFISATIEANNFKFGIQLGIGIAEKQLLRQKFGSGSGEQPKKISATVEASNFKFGIQLGLWEWLTEKQLLGPKLAGVRAGARLGEHPKKFGTRYLFLQPLKLATSNLVHNFGLGSTLQ